jgi:DNA-binding transcriptional LysR family regulator
MDRLTEMEAFATVVDQGGFTDAAKKMGISKSAVIGGAILDHSSGGIVLSRAA